VTTRETCASICTNGTWLAWQRLGEEIRSATGAVLGPSEIIRALVEALDEAGGVEPSLIASEEDLVDVFYRHFVRQEDRRRDRDRMRSE
jgi:hypothetical protein